MRVGDRYMAVGDEEFILEIINPDNTWEDINETTFSAKVISFPKNPKVWSNKQIVDSIGTYLHKDFKPDIVYIRNKKLNELGI